MKLGKYLSDFGKLPLLALLLPLAFGVPFQETTLGPADRLPSRSERKEGKVSDGIILGNGIILGVGHLLGDGAVVKDGIILGDGLTRGDRTVISDRAIEAAILAPGDGVHLN